MTWCSIAIAIKTTKCPTPNSPKIPPYRGILHPINCSLTLHMIFWSVGMRAKLRCLFSPSHERMQIGIQYFLPIRLQENKRAQSEDWTSLAYKVVEGFLREKEGHGVTNSWTLVVKLLLHSRPATYGKRMRVLAHLQNGIPQWNPSRKRILTLKWMHKRPLTSSLAQYRAKGKEEQLL